MKVIMFIFMVMISMFKVFSETIEFESTVIEELNAIDKNSSRICDHIDKNIKKGVKISRIGFMDLVNTVASTFGDADVDTINSRILFSKNDFGNKGVELVDENSFVCLASDFINKLPYPISTLENTKVLDVKYERSVEQLKGKKECSKIRTHTAVIKMGRILHNMPVFNSYATVGFNAVDNSLKYFDLKNWVPVDIVPVADYQKKINKNIIEQAIRKKVQRHLDKENKFKKVTIEEIKCGWQIIDHQKVTPAVIFHGVVFDIEEQKKVEKISYLEIL